MNLDLEGSYNRGNYGLSARDLKLPYYEQFLSERELSLMKYDREGLRMSIPFGVSQIVAEKIPGNYVIDLCCGVGSFAISLALTGKRVLAVDINPNRLSIAQENARSNSVDHLIDFQLQDCRDVPLKGNTVPVFFDPPWGGSARRVSEFTLSNFEFDIRGQLMTLVESECYLAIKLPFNFRFSDLEQFCSSWRFTPIEHEKLQTQVCAPARPLFWLAEHNI
jgi:predicted RNA methylase